MILEKLRGGVCIGGAFAAMSGAKMMDLPVWIVAPIVIAGVCAALYGIVMVFAEGSTEPTIRRVKTNPSVGDAVKDVAS